MGTGSFHRNGKWDMENEGWWCPWCGLHAPPLLTAEHQDKAEWVLWGKGTPADVARNPYMCRECYGVGGKEDWVL
jgi:hypothetical protein